MSVALDGPRIPASGGRAKGLVVFLHGYGADGGDLIELGKHWRALLPQTAFVSPHAPERCAGAPTGRQWFALTNRPPHDPGGAEDRWNGVVKARGPIDAFLDAELERLGLDDSKLALVGFSQGSMMAMHLGLRRRRAPAAILGYSGLLVGARASEGGDGSRRARRSAARAARPRRPGPAHSARGDVRGGRGAGGGRHSCPVAHFFRRGARNRRRRPASWRPVHRPGAARKGAVTGPARGARRYGRKWWRASKACSISHGDTASYAVFVSEVFPAGRENGPHFGLLCSEKRCPLNDLRQRGGNRNRKISGKKIVRNREITGAKTAISGKESNRRPRGRAIMDEKGGGRRRHAQSAWRQPMRFFVAAR